MLVVLDAEDDLTVYLGFAATRMSRIPSHTAAVRGICIYRRERVCIIIKHSHSPIYYGLTTLSCNDLAAMISRYDIATVPCRGYIGPFTQDGHCTKMQKTGIPNLRD